MKTLEQIQEENRKAVIMVNNPATKDKPITLDKVLIVASNCNATYYPDSNGLKVGIFNHDKDESKEFLAEWDLTKTTLEEQSEGTQRIINKLLIK